MIVHVNGIDLYYETIGEGRPLVMIHGNGEDHRIFLEAAQILKKDFCCYLVDSRGHGQSSKVSPLHYADMAADMLAFLEQLDLRDVLFYGFSDGGIVGLLAAAESKRITALAVSGANLTPEGVKPGLRLLLRVLYFFKRDDKIRLMLREPQIGEELLRRIHARTLVLAGDRDLIRQEQTRQIAAGIPGAELRILLGEDHGSYIIHKEKIGRILREFALEQS